MSKEVKNSKTEVPCGICMNDKDYMNSILSSLKEMSKNYVVALTEASNEVLFKKLKKDFDKIIDFVRNYADNHHHKKEEKILFVKMVEELGEPAEKAVKQGMLVEHDLGRLHIRELVEALDKLKAGEEEAKLDVIANAISYSHLLTRHIDKEDRVIYKFAERNLKRENKLKCKERWRNVLVCGITRIVWHQGFDQF